MSTLQWAELDLDVSMLHLDVSTLQRPMLLLDVSTPHGPERQLGAIQANQDKPVFTCVQRTAAMQTWQSVGQPGRKATSIRRIGGTSKLAKQHQS